MTGARNSHGQVSRAAVVQAGTTWLDTERTLQQLSDWTATAAREGARIVVFPEAFLGGYPKGHDFGVRVGQRTSDGRELYRQYVQSAITVPGPGTEYLGKLARDFAVYLVVGIVERMGATLYCTALFFDPLGHLLGFHRKLMPTAMERVIWGNGDGSTLPVFPTSLGKIGAVICWENYMPLLRMAMYARGIEVYCALTVDDRETWLPTVRHIALEGRCFVLSACQHVAPKATVAACQHTEVVASLANQDSCNSHGNSANSTSGATVEGSVSTINPVAPIRGGSCIIGPLGNILGGPLYNQDGIVIADLDLDEIARARFDFDVAGHYARPDVFRLEVNTRPQCNVDFSEY